MKKKKVYFIMVSRRFPDGHPQAGKETGFPEKIEKGIKIHTIRKNYELWSRRVSEIQKGNAVLSLRYWEGLAYRSPHHEFRVLTKDDGVGIEPVIRRVQEGRTVVPWSASVMPVRYITWETNGFLITPNWDIAKNDGLSEDDFNAWFRGDEKPMAIIHFTGFRYGYK